MFVEFKIYISLKPNEMIPNFLGVFVEFKIYISLKLALASMKAVSVCRIQNLHISQTLNHRLIQYLLFVEFKIYISLKLLSINSGNSNGL